MTSTIRRRILAGSMFIPAALAATSWPAMVGAQPAPAWPTKTVRLVVPSPAGTAPDVIARVVGDKLSRMWGQQVLIDNRPGAGGIIGMVALKGAEKDDHSFGFLAASILTLSPYMYRSQQVDIPNDFTPFGLVGLSPMMLATAANSPANSLADLVKMAKTRPGGIVSAVPLQYSTPHLASELLARATGAPIRSVPFSNTAQTVAAVVSDDAQITIDGVPPLDAMIKGGRLKALSIFADGRVPGRPQLEAVNETYPSMVINGWFAVVAPKGTNERATTRFHDDLAKVVAMPDVVERLDALGVYPKPMAQDQVAAYAAAERARWEKVLQELNAQPMN